MEKLEEWKESIRKKIHYISNSLWDGLTFDAVEKFIKNFDEDNKIVGWVIMDMLIYYSEEQEQSIFNNLIRLMERELWVHYEMPQRGLSSKAINNELQQVYKQLCFVPVDESNPSASSFNLTHFLSKSSSIPSSVQYIDIIDIPLMIALQYKYFVFYDDLVGTGDQFEKFFNKPRYGKDEKNKKSVNDLAQKNQDVMFYYLVVGACENGYQKLTQLKPNVRVIVSEYFAKNTSVIDENNEYWELYPDLKEKVIDYIMKKEKELGIHNIYGEYVPVLFQHGRASNTALELLWYDKNNKWKGLYKR